MEKQKTLKSNCSIKGKGLHLGKEVNVSFLPASANHGIKFKRVDLENKPIIPALATWVGDTARGTSLRSADKVEVKTIEHLMAALAGLNIDNLLIEIDSEEMPIMNGSSLPFIEIFEQAGILEQDAPRNELKIISPIHWKDPENNNIEFIVTPFQGFEVSVEVDYKTKILGKQSANLNNINDFKAEIAPCRTFCFLHEILPLIKANLIKGGDVENAIVYVEHAINDEEKEEIATFFNRHDITVENTGTLNNTSLVFPNEVARHKLLDLIGDLYLIGMPLKAHVFAKHPGHAANTRFARFLMETIQR